MLKGRLFIYKFAKVAFSSLVLCGLVAAQNDTERSGLQSAYLTAIYEAAVYKFSNIRPLKPLVFGPTNTTLVVTVTGYNGYNLGDLVLDREVWVTAVPEVKESCRAFSGDIPLRLRQLLGLPPTLGVDKFVTFEVREGDAFRPAADPNPTTYLPCNANTLRCGEDIPENVDATHIRWMANQMLNSYIVSESPLFGNGYPWTRLGYTFDWKPGAGKYGASEYVLRRNAKVIVKEITSISQYCSAN
jgi:hypothetical protein